MSAHVIVSNPDGPVARVRLARPEKKNAVTLEMLDALSAAGRDLAARDGLRAVVISGEGGDFCAGLDTGVLMSMAGDLEAVKAQMLAPKGRGANRFQQPAVVWQEVPVPVIAVLDGVCFGAGAQIALCADFRIAAPGAKISIMEAKWGLIPDMGISQALPRLMPVDRAKELILTARILSGQEALAEGLVTRVAADPHAAAAALAEELAARSPSAVRAGKALVDALWGREAGPDLTLEAELQAALIGGADQIETVMAQMQKRPPRYG